MSEKTIRVFIDSNVWFSALYGSQNCRTLIKAHQEGNITAVISYLVLSEIVRNVKKKIPSSENDLQQFLTNTPPEIVPNPKDIPQKLIGLASPKDLPIFISSIQAHVPYFITGNTKDFFVAKLEKLTGIKILTPKEAMELLQL